MLTLHRPPGTEVIIETPEGRFIRIAVGHGDKLSFEADPGVRIDRREVWDQRQAAQAAGRAK